MALKKKFDSAAMAAEINADVDNNAATETVVPKVQVEDKSKKKANSLAELLTPKREELKSDTLTIRVKPSVRKKFEVFCKKKGVSRASMFEFWVENIAK